MSNKIETIYEQEWKRSWKMRWLLRWEGFKLMISEWLAERRAKKEIFIAEIGTNHIIEKILFFKEIIRLIEVIELFREKRVKWDLEKAKAEK